MTIKERVKTEKPYYGWSVKYYVRVYRSNHMDDFYQEGGFNTVEEIPEELLTKNFREIWVWSEADSYTRRIFIECKTKPFTA